MVPNMLFWHETSSAVEKVEKSSFKNFQVTLPGFQRHFGVFLCCWKIKKNFESSDHQDME